MVRTVEYTAEPADARAASFERAYAEHHEALVRFAGVMAGGDRDKAEDTVAEVFATLLRKRNWMSVDDLGAYLRRCVVNELRDGWRKERRRSLIWGRFGGATGATRQGSTPQEASAADFAPAADQRRRILGAVAQLPAQQRAVIVLRLYEDRSEAETAEILGVPVGTVKSSLARARATLSTLLTQSDGEG